MQFLFVDRILNLIPGSLTQGIKHITQEDYYLSLDEAGRLCFIPSLIGETLGQLAAWNVMAACEFKQRPVAGIVASATLHRNAYVGETLILESVIDSLDETAVQYHSVARVGDELVFSIEGALGPLVPMEDFINFEVVRRQFTEINRPGEWPISPVCGAQYETQALDVPFHAALMRFDYITESTPGVRISAVKHITKGAPYFPDHFPNKPVLPMTVLLECQLNLAREFLNRAALSGRYVVQTLRKIKMNEFVYPGDVVFCTAVVKQQDDSALVLQFRSEVNGKRVCVLEVVMNAKGPL